MAQRSSSSSSIDTSSAAPQCSICLEVVVDNHGRSTARLQCGHLFHLGAMQCPNCRVIENGEWLYATGGMDQSIDYADDDDLYPDDMNSPETEWCPFNGYSGAPPTSGEGIIIRTANAITEDVLNIFAGASNPLVYPWIGHQMATGYQMPSSVNGIQLHQQSWIPQAPFPSNITAANQPLNPPPILELSGTFSYTAPSPASSAQPVIHNHRSAPAGAWGSTDTSSGLPYNVPPQNRFGIPSDVLQSNFPSPPVLASMLRRRRGSNNPRFINPTRPLPASPVHASGSPMFPSSEPYTNNAPNEVLLPRGSSAGPDHGMQQQGHTLESMPPDNQTDGSGFAGLFDGP
ncbi:E3 ubiquitin-protein ligase IPI1-like [Cornus florida]|uniref:E3 ubiquitin-protein ligase IPI1-like n=1 Tax=Cornus florida TaxID=4283 RepID=UPI002897FE62|nr:E3 ubiquitin-protein ligase IPI1-like [Cornus florida]